MKHILSPKLLLFSNRMSKIPFVKSLIKPIYYPYKNYVAKKRNQSFLENALSLIKDFDKCMNQNGIAYTLAFGTMLGAVREHGFIKHDCDLDVFIWIDDFSEHIHDILQNAGFILEHTFLVEDGTLGREETFSKYEVSIDIFYIYPAINKYNYTCDFRPCPDMVTCENSMKKTGRVLARRLEIPISRERILMPFEDTKLYVPQNYNEFLQFRYGNDYMIPNPKWKNGDNPHIIEWTDKTAIFY